MSAEVARNVSGRADEISTKVTQHVGEMTQLLDEKSNGLLAAISGKGQDLAGEVSRITDQAVKSIEAKSFVFTQTMMENSEEIARLINDASLTATAAMTRSLGQLQEGAQGVSEAAKTTITRTLEDVQSAHHSAIEESKQTASATIADMLETHGMLRSDTTALFERLREANILLQEVLSGAHENMSSLERTMVTRVSEFVGAMNDLNAQERHQRQRGAAACRLVQRHHRQGAAASSANSPRNSARMAARSRKRSSFWKRAIAAPRNRCRPSGKPSRRWSPRSTRAPTISRQRLARFSGLLDESLDAATSRAREIASVIARTSNASVQTIEQQYELVRATSEEERRRTGETLNTALRGSRPAQAHTLLNNPPSASPRSCRA